MSKPINFDHTLRIHMFHFGHIDEIIGVWLVLGFCKTNTCNDGNMER